MRTLLILLVGVLAVGAQQVVCGRNSPGSGAIGFDCSLRALRGSCVAPWHCALGRYCSQMCESDADCVRYERAANGTEPLVCRQVGPGHFCAHSCRTDADCDDGDALTIDTCHTTSSGNLCGHRCPRWHPRK